MSDFPRTLKHITLWLVIGTVVFLGVQAWQAQQQRSRFASQGGEIVLKRAPDGHFHWPGTVNGQAVDFLVDTGATRTTLPQPLAQAAGLTPEGTVQGQTAGGAVQGWVARADIVLQGGIQVDRHPVTVLPALQTPLLGMDLLGRMRYSQADGVLRLRPPAR